MATLCYVNEKLHPACSYIGKVEDIESMNMHVELGTIVFDTMTNQMYMYTGSNWMLMGVNNNKENNNKEKIIKRIKCKSCGADLNMKKVSDNGMCRCEWCRSFNYVW